MDQSQISKLNSSENLDSTSNLDKDTVFKLAKKQKTITISEFFEKNKQILGFDNLAKSLTMCIKEMVDNSLDACQDYQILPEIIVQVKRVASKTYKIIVQDNGPGILKNKIGNVFGKLLYGSKFHSYRQTRGQQGIGVSAAVLYSQITTTKPANIITKYTGLEKAIRTQLKIDIMKNKPKIISQRSIEWDKTSGTRIELEIAGLFVTTGKHSLKEYLGQVSLINPHARIIFKALSQEIIYDRILQKIPIISKDVKPHPQSLELGVLERIVHNTKFQNCIDFLTDEFYGINYHTAIKYLQIANIQEFYNPRYLTPIEIRNLFQSLKTYDLYIPVESLSLIGQEFIKSSLLKKEYDFVGTYIGQAGIHSGNAFVIESAICYSNKLPKDSKVQLIRICNKIPLIYQQSACLVTNSVIKTNWSNYGLRQSQDQLPTGPVVIFLHLASTKVPYTSEAKEAVADIKEIRTALNRVISKLGQKLHSYLKKQELLNKLKEKQKIVSELIPYFYKLICTSLNKPLISPKPIISKIMDSLVYLLESNNLETINYTNSKQILRIIYKQDSQILNCEFGIRKFKLKDIPINILNQNSNHIIYNLNKLGLNLQAEYSSENPELYSCKITELNLRNQSVLEKLNLVIQEFYNQISYNIVPNLEIRSRTKHNIIESQGYWVLSDKTSIKSGKNIGSMRQILQFAHSILFLISQFSTNKNSTLRELYYISESWNYSKFETQAESNYLIENLEVLIGHPREEFRIWPESNGHMFGPLVLKQNTRQGLRTLDCAKDVNQGGYVIPFDLNFVELLSTQAKFIIGIETSGMFKRLIQNKFDANYNCILVSLEGQPARSTRKIFKMISDRFNIPGIIFTDSDAWSMRIFAAMTFGSIKTSHLSSSLATPYTKFLGVKPTDIQKYKLPTDKLRSSDIAALKQLLTDPRFADQDWQNEIKFQLQAGVKSEQQALAKYGLDYVTDVYLPEKLKEMQII
jgi:DNA topoisomerase-6 subunit B